MIDMKPTSKNIITALENNLNDMRKDQLMQLIIREELECIVIKFPLDFNQDESPTWMNLVTTVYVNGGFKKKYKENKEQFKL